MYINNVSDREQIDRYMEAKTPAYSFDCKITTMLRLYDDDI